MIFEDWLGDAFSGGVQKPLVGLHVSRAGDFYWPGANGVERLPATAPALSPNQIRGRVLTDEIRRC